MLETVQIPIFVISLESATERRGYLLKHLKKLGVDYLLLNGTTPQELPIEKRNSAIAVWDSHIRALRHFLETDSEFSLILEDDVDLESNIKVKEKVFGALPELCKSIPTGYQILQLGYVPFRKRNLLFVLLRELYFLVYKNYQFDGRNLKSLKKDLGTQKFNQCNLRLREITGWNSLVVDGFGAGTQSYICSRKAAKFLIQIYEEKRDWDSNSRFSMDTLIENMNKRRETPAEIKSLRFSKQIFEQRDIPTVNSYFPQNLNKTI